MTYQEAVDVMLGLVRTVAQAQTPVIVQTWTDVPASTPTADALWLRGTVKHEDRRQASLAGADAVVRWENAGTLWVQLFAPGGAGLTKGREKGDLFVRALEKYKGDVWFRHVRMEEMGADGKFERFDIKANFQYDSFD